MQQQQKNKMKRKGACSSVGGDRVLPRPSYHCDWRHGDGSHLHQTTTSKLCKTCCLPKLDEVARTGSVKTAPKSNPTECAALHRNAMATMNTRMFPLQMRICK